MTAAYAIFDACYKGRVFRKPKGTSLWRAEKLVNINAWNPSYVPYYYAKVRNIKTGKTEKAEYEYGFKRWIPNDDVSAQDFNDKMERALDGVFGRPWYRPDKEEERLYGSSKD